MPSGPSRSALGIIVVSAILLVVGFAARWRATESPPPSPPAHPGLPTPPPPRAEARPFDAPASQPPLRSAAKKDAEPEADLMPDDDAAASAWAKLDLEAVRAAMPDNLYWKMSAPTTDPEVLRWREEERARWNAEYGKVLSNTATDEEIDAYYAERKRLSDDYLEFVVHVLTNYGEALPREGVAMLKLAGELHAARLEELPRQIAEAHARREQHDAARRAWLEEQKAYATPPSGAP